MLVDLMTSVKVFWEEVSIQNTSTSSICPTSIGGWAAHETTSHEGELNSSSDFLFLSLYSTPNACLFILAAPQCLSGSAHTKWRCLCSGCLCKGSSFDLARASLTDWQMVPFKLICSIWIVSCWHFTFKWQQSEKISWSEFWREPDTNNMQVKRLK